MAERCDKMVGSIKFEEVRKTFIAPNGETVNALNGVDLEIEKGSFVCLIGPSGCGKSTMLRLLAGLDTPTSGSIYLDEKKVTKPDHDRGLVFQDPNLFPWLNIYDNTAGYLMRICLFKALKTYKFNKIIYICFSFLIYFSYLKAESDIVIDI